MRYVSRLAVLCLCAAVPGVFGQTLSITNYQLVSSQKITTSLAYVTYKADIINKGNPIGAVLATASTLDPASFTVAAGEDTLKFAQVPANTPVTSSNTFTIRVDRTIPFDVANITWTFQTTPLPPVSNPGPNQTVKVGQTVTLNGSGSTNPSGVGTLAYNWAFMLRPGGAAQLNSPTAMMPTFTIDMPGNYVVALTVNNGVASSTSNVMVSTLNSPPVANAGPNQTTVVGATVFLDGSHSSDIDGNGLTYRWNFVSLPTGSLATLTGGNTVSPGFVIDKPGTYQIRLLVNDGTADSVPAVVTITTQNSSPVASAGPNQSVNLGSLVHLTGAGSTDVDGDPLTYRWAFTSRPLTSNAALSSLTDPLPTFTLDVPGTYVAQLIVNDGHVDSLPSTIVVTTNAMLPPSANAGPNQTALHGKTVLLEGSGTDPQGFNLTYQWSLTNKPAGSLAVLSSTNALKPTFVADLPGTYVVQLIVNDGYASSPPAIVNITTTNTAPVAKPGLDQTVLVGAATQLDGSASVDADNDLLTYSWSILSRPAGSNALIPSPAVVQPTFIPDVTGTYIVQLIVNDGFTNSQPANVTITAVDSFRFSFTPNPLNLNTTVSGSVRISLPFAAGSGGQDVLLQSFDTGVATVPSSAHISAGGTFVDVPVTPVRAGGTSILAFCSGGCAYQPGTGVVNVNAATISLALTSGNLAIGEQTNGTITLSLAAPAGGTTVNLTSTPPGAVQFTPASVPISAGGTSGTVTVNALVAGPATITASATSYISGTANVTVSQLGAMSLPANATVTQGQSTPFAVSLAAPAPAGGVTISLTSTDTSVVVVTPSVFIGPGLTTPATGAQISGRNPGHVTVSAAAQGFAGTSSSVTVAALLTITPTSLAAGQVGEFYSQTLHATGGSGAYNWQLTAGSLPAGLNLDAASGTISGTPTATASAIPLTFKVTDSASPAQTTSANFSLTISTAGLRITTTSLPNGNAGVAYSSTLTAAGGTSPYSWQLVSGSLPDGLSLSPSNGLISGTPSAITSAVSLTFKVTDSTSPALTATAILSLTIAPGPLKTVTTSLPNGQVGVAYSQALAATGGTAPYSWSLTGGTLPSGLTLGASSGLISGTPATAANAAPLTFKVTDSASPAQTATVTVALTVTVPPLTITTTSLPNAVVNAPYAVALQASGGTAPYNWVVSGGRLPSGLSLDSSGLINGTPFTTSNTTITFTVTDSSSPAQSKTELYPLVVGLTGVTINTTGLLSGTVNQPYPPLSPLSNPNNPQSLCHDYPQFCLSAIGAPPFTWSLIFGTLPAGLTLDATTGAITGTPTEVVTDRKLVFQASDFNAQSTIATLKMSIASGPLAIMTTSLHAGTVGAAYSQTLAFNGGVPATTWQLTAGTLPDGLTLNATTGEISGTPTTPVTAAPLTFKLSDSATPVHSVTADLTLTIGAGQLTITTTSLPNGTLGAAYSQTLVAVGGNGDHTWQLTSGTLPGGLTLNSLTGAITGTPNSLVNATPLTFKATDSGSPVQTASVDLTLTIVIAPLSISTTSLPDGIISTPYSKTLTAIGGTGAYTWQLTSGTLPSGLSLNTATGLISGTTSAPVSATPLTFKVTDSGSPAQTAVVNLTLTVSGGVLTITTTSLPTPFVDVPYSVTLTATGGTPPYTWSVIQGRLPGGFELDPATGLLHGTPLFTDPSAMVFQVMDSSSPAHTATTNLILNTQPNTLTLATTSLPDGQIGVAYSQALLATGGATPYSWLLTSGSLPGGLSLNASTGVISGTPTAAVTNSRFTVQVKDSSTPAETSAGGLQITIIGGTPLAITNTSLANGAVGTAYSQTLAVTGGVGPYSWQLTSGVLPAGLTLSASGLISGTPSLPASATPLTFKVSDSSSPAQTASVNLALTIAPAILTIGTTSLPNGQVGAAYSQTLVATGGTGAVSWLLTNGTLPAGLTLNASTGLISGTPTSPVTAAALTFKATDSASTAQTATVNLALTITPATLAITTTSLANGVVNTGYSQTLAATGGTGAYNWQLIAGTLPAGLALNASSGLISGTPTLPVAAASLTFRVTDSASPAQTVTANFTITIAPAVLTITTTSLPNGQAGVAYTQMLAATGGTGALTWQLTSGTLPAGLTLNASTGLISGTPTTPIASTPLTFKVTDSASTAQTAVTTLNLTIAPAPLTITTVSLATGVVGVPYSQSVAATGGTGAYNWLLTVGTLPAGLSLNATTGLISGTPTTPITSTPLTFKVTDSASSAQTATAAFTLTIAPPALTITTTSLANGVSGTAYSQTLQSAGGVAPFFWQLTAGALPTGLSLNASTGVISGTPAIAVTATPLTFKVTDSSSTPQSATASLTLTIAPPPLTITTSSLANAQVGVGYSQSLTATGGTGSYTWQLIAGTMPQGLALNASSGLINGTPGTAGTATPLTFKVTDSGSPAQTATVNLTMTIAPPTLVITTASLSAGQVNVPYSLTLAATGGTGTYSWQLTAGTLPAGLTLSAAGLISGTPTTPIPSAPLTFKVTDSGSPVQTATANLNLVIAPAPLTITTASLANGQVGVAYSQTLAATGGTGALTWQLTAGTLPAGLSLNFSTGVISGNPTVPVTATLGFKVSDLGSPIQTANASFTVTIAPAPLTITTASLPSGQAGAAYSQTLTATGGTGAFNWQLTAGTLPAGLTLNATSGLISGTPALPVTAASLTFKVTDAGSPVQTTTATLSLTIAPAPLTITTASLPNGQAGVAYSQTLAATGGTGAYTWLLTAGTLPGGLTLNASSGLISGTPALPVTAASLTFKVTDSGSPAQTTSVTLNVTIIPAPLAITTSTLPNATVGVVYGQSLAATGGTGAYTWQLTAGTLPAGLSLTASSGLISGTPSALVTAAPLTFKVTDSASPAQTTSVSLTLTVLPPPLTITTSSLHNGAVSSPYTQALAASGGTGSYTWALVSGALPNGLSLNSASGQITGTPTAPVNLTPLGFKVTDSASPAQTATTILTLTILPVQLSITTSSLPNGVGGNPYSATMVASGGTTPYTWTATGLPPGLVMTSAGQIIGSPSALGTASVTITVTDSSTPTAATAQTVLSLTVARFLFIQTSSLDAANAGVPYTFTVTATGGTGLLTWSASNLPSGLTMSPTGQISGTTSAGSAQVTLLVVDSGSPQQSASVVLPLTVIGGASGTFTLTPISVGKNLQGVVTISIPQAAPDGGLALSITSADPTKLVFNGQFGVRVNVPEAPPITVESRTTENPAGYPNPTTRSVTWAEPAEVVPLICQVGDMVRPDGRLTRTTSSCSAVAVTVKV